VSGDRTSVARNLAAPEGPTIVTGDLVVNVCSLDRDMTWPTRGGDIVVTRLSDPGSSRVFHSTSTQSTTGIPAGLAFGPDGALYVADEGHRAMLRLTADLEQTAFITEFQGKQINGPNDLSFDEGGNLYFTDPWTSNAQNPVGAVYGYDWETGSLRLVDEGMAFPNGIVARNGALFVAETFTNSIWRYQIDGPGRADGRELFYRLPDVPGAEVQGPDGMACDAEGRLFVTHLASSHVYVVDAQGSEVGRIEVGGTHPTNVCFGGQRHDQLLVTVDDIGELQRIELGVKGDLLSFCPSQQGDGAWARTLTAILDADSGGPA
jgi:gluconolactonase